MLFVLVFFVIVATAEFLSGLIMDRMDQSEENSREDKPMPSRLGTAFGISLLTMLVAFFFQGPDGMFEMSTDTAMPFLVMAAIVGAGLNALPFPFVSNTTQSSLAEVDFGEVVRTTVLGAMLRQLLMGILAVLFLVGVFVIALLCGVAN